MKILINLKSDKAKKMIFLFLIACVAAYFVYILVTYFFTDKTGIVQLSFKTDEVNILSKAEATYSLKEGNGRLIMSSGEEIYFKEEMKSDSAASSSAEKSEKKTDGIVSIPIRLKTTGGNTGEVDLTLSYDTSLMSIDKENIILVKIDSSGNTEKAEFENDTKTNKIHAKVNADDSWALADKSILN